MFRNTKIFHLKISNMKKTNLYGNFCFVQVHEYTLIIYSNVATVAIPKHKSFTSV